MDTEFEVKFFPVNKVKYRKKLNKAGAKLLQPERKMRRVIFDGRSQKVKFSCDYIRIRDEGDVVRLSAKIHAREDGNISDQKEIDVVVSDFDKTVAILKEAGLRANRFQDTKRETWTLDGAEITIDTWPWLDTYTEIEGKSEEVVRKVSEKLGFDWGKKLVASVTEIFMKVYDLGEEATLDKLSYITFEKNPFKGLKKQTI